MGEVSFGAHGVGVITLQEGRDRVWWVVVFALYRAKWCEVETGGAVAVASECGGVAFCDPDSFSVEYRGVPCVADLSNGE